MVIQKYIILGRYGNYLGQKQNKPCLSCFPLRCSVSLEGGEVVADTVGKINDSVGKAFDSVNNIVDSVGNRLYRQINKIRTHLV